jgi:hypothetical protein
VDPVPDPLLDYLTLLRLFKGRAVSLAVSRRIPTAAAKVRARVRSCGICGGRSDTVAGFLRVLRFPLPSIPPTAAHLSSFIIPGTICQVVASIIVDLVRPAMYQYMTNGECVYLHPIYVLCEQGYVFVI